MNENKKMIRDMSESIDIGEAIAEIIESCAKSKSLDPQDVADYVIKSLLSRYGLGIFQISKDSINDILSSLLDGKSPMVVKEPIKLDQNYGLYSEVIKKQEKREDSENNQKLTMSSEELENDAAPSIYSPDPKILRLVEEDAKNDKNASESSLENKEEEQRNSEEINNDNSLEEKDSSEVKKLQLKNNPWESAGDAVSPGTLSL